MTRDFSNQNPIQPHILTNADPKIASKNPTRRGGEENGNGHFTQAVRLAKSLVRTKDMVRKHGAFIEVLKKIPKRYPIIGSDKLLESKTTIEDNEPPKQLLLPTSPEGLEALFEECRPFVDSLIEDVKKKVFHVNYEEKIVTGEMFMGTLIRWPYDLLEGYLAWLIVYNVNISRDWSDGSGIGISRVVPRVVQDNMSIFQGDMSCFDKQHKVTFGVWYRRPWGEHIAYYTDKLMFEGRVSESTKEIEGEREGKIEEEGDWGRSTSVLYELNTVRWGLDFGIHCLPYGVMKELVIQTDSLHLKRFLDGYYTLPSEFFESYISTIEILRCLNNYAPEYYPRESNIGADSIARFGDAPLSRMHRFVIGDGLESIAKAEEELQSVVRLPKVPKIYGTKHKLNHQQKNSYSTSTASTAAADLGGGSFMGSESGGEDADAQLCDKQEDSSRCIDADVHTAIEELRTSLKRVWKHKGKSIQVSRRQSEVTMKDVSQVQKITMLPYSQPCCFLDTHNLSWFPYALHVISGQKSRFGMTNDLQRFIFARNSQDSFGLSSNIWQFHTSWTSGGSLLSGFPKGREVRLKKIAGIEQKSQKVPASNWVNAYAFAAKRVIRRV